MLPRAPSRCRLATTWLLPVDVVCVTGFLKGFTCMSLGTCVGPHTPHTPGTRLPALLGLSVCCGSVAFVAFIYLLASVVRMPQYEACTDSCWPALNAQCCCSVPSWPEIVCTKQDCSQQAAGYSATSRSHSAHSLKPEPQANPGPTRQNTQRSMLQPCTLQVSVCVCCLRGPTSLTQLTQYDRIAPHSSLHAPLATQHTAAVQSWRKDQRTRTRQGPVSASLGA